MSNDQTKFLAAAVLICLAIIGAVLWARRPPPPPRMTTSSFFSKMPSTVTITVGGKVIAKRHVLLAYTSGPSSCQVIYTMDNKFVTVSDGMKNMVVQVPRGNVTDLIYRVNGPHTGFGGELRLTAELRYLSLMVVDITSDDCVTPLIGAPNVRLLPNGDTQLLFEPHPI